MNREQSAARARELYDRLMSLPRPDGISNNEWTTRAGVNMSFFTNLKNGSEPSVGNLRAVLEVIDISLPEFFAGEANGRLFRLPSRERLERAIAAALPGLPRNQGRRAEYLSEVVLACLSIPEDRLSNLDQTDEGETGDRVALVATR